MYAVAIDESNGRYEEKDFAPTGIACTYDVRRVRDVRADLCSLICRSRLVLTGEGAHYLGRLCWRMQRTCQ